MLKVYFITRSYPSVKDSGGGALIRKAQVSEFERLGYSVVIVVPDFSIKTVVQEESLVRVPAKYNIRITHRLERLGIVEGYLDVFVKNAYKYLTEIIVNEDIIFATTGGEIDCIKLGAKLKKIRDVKFIVNYHDPINFTEVRGYLSSDEWHYRKDSYEKKYVRIADLVITSSELMREHLITKYPDLKGRVVNSYFGYITRFEELINRMPENRVVVAYGGTFSKTQSPELLAEIIVNSNTETHAYFIGNWSTYDPILNYRKYSRIHLIPPMDYENFLRFMKINVDIGFVSLGSEYYGACVPSKIYEYLNLELPMLGALPEGDGKDLINRNNWGLAKHFTDKVGLEKALNEMTDKVKLKSFKKSVADAREGWNMQRHMERVVYHINELFT